MFACNLDKTINVDITAPTGPTGPIGLRGYDGNSSRWKANTQGFTPLTGQFHIISTGNAIVINQVDSNTNDMLTWLQDTKVGDIITIREVDNPAMVGYFSLVSLFSFLLPNVWQATISYISGPITGIVPATVPLFHYIGFVPIGPTGVQGPTGSIGPTGYTGPTRAMALYSFATPKLTGLTDTAGATDRWCFASRGLGWRLGAGTWTPTANTPWGTQTIVLDTTQNFYGTETAIAGPALQYRYKGWFNNWYIDCSDNQLAVVNFDKRIAIQGPIGGTTNLNKNNYGIRFRGPQTGTAVLNAYSSENLVPTIWAAHQPYQNGVIGTNIWYKETDDGVGVAFDYGSGGGTLFSSMTGPDTDAAIGWRPSTQNYIAAPKPNSNGFIAGFNITGMAFVGTTGTFIPNTTVLDDYAYIEIEFVEGEFGPAGGSGGVVGQGRCRDINPISLIKKTHLTVTCPGSATGTAVKNQGAYEDDWTTILNPADYIRITNISYFRLRTHIHVRALNSQDLTIGHPEIEIPAGRFKIGAQLYILWDQ